MIKSKFTFLFLFTSIVLLQSQTRFPITYKSAWRVDSVDSNWEVAENTKYFIQGDTSIKNIKYFKLYKSGLMILDQPFLYSNVYVGAIRDNDNKIYFINRKTSKERLLFDFNLKEGDTIKSEIANGKTVLSIDSLLDGRRIFNYDISHYTAGYIIEGIGTNGGLFSLGTNMIVLHSGECACYLICYSEDGVLKFQCPENESNCDIINPHNQYKIERTSSWKISKSRLDEPDYYETYQYLITGDTVISGLNYFTLIKRYNRLSQNEEGKYSVRINETEFVGSIRDKENKYYFVPKGSLTEELLYDFNLKTGDQVQGKIYKGEHVLDVSAILDNRKIFYLGNDHYSKRIIAGIGSVKDFLNDRDEQCYLNCYLENGVAIYNFLGIYKSDLTFEDASFFPCNNIRVLPNYFCGTEKQLKVTLCYQIPSLNGSYPTLKSYLVEKEEKTYRISLFYEDNNILSSDDTLIAEIVTDTIPFGILEEGYYSAEVSVNVIHAASGNDTSFNDIRFDYDIFSYYPHYYSIKNSLKSKISVYPNPSSGKLFIKSENNSGIKSAEVYNLVGIKVLEEKYIGKQSFELNLSGLKKGIYVLKVNEKEGYSVQKIIFK